MSRRFVVALAVLLAIAPGGAAAQPMQGCFLGADANGQSMRMVLVAERIGELFEIHGELHGPAFGVMRLKADGWSGAGRIFRNHEYESGALYIMLSDFTGSSIVLGVEGYGRTLFRSRPC